MRLICPNCGAQYEIADTVIPPEGREVECSNCTHIWFQARSAPEAPVRELAPSALSILREEAARELAERRRERTGGLPDAQALASTLTPPEPAPPPRPEPRLQPEPVPEIPASGYAAGFVVAAVIGMALLSAYLLAGLMMRNGSDALWLLQAMVTVDGWRLWLFDHTLGLLRA